MLTFFLDLKGDSGLYFPKSIFLCKELRSINDCFLTIFVGGDNQGLSVELITIEAEWLVW